MKRLIAVILLIIGMTWFYDTYACEDTRHAYLFAGVGQAGTWLDSSPEPENEWNDNNGAHAMLGGGYRWPVYDKWLWAGFEVGHHSTFTESPPEPELDYAIIRIEARIYD
jgi:hypothetical protein